MKTSWQRGITIWKHLLFWEKSLRCSLQKRKPTTSTLLPRGKTSLRVKWRGGIWEVFEGGYLRWAFEAAGILGVGKCRRCGPIGHCGTEVSRGSFGGQGHWSQGWKGGWSPVKKEAEGISANWISESDRANNFRIQNSTFVPRCQGKNTWLW